MYQCKVYIEVISVNLGKSSNMKTNVFYSSNNYLLDIYSVPETELYTRNTMVYSSCRYKEP